MADVWANSMACHPRATCHIGGCCHLANSMLWFQSYVSHCKVLPFGEFTVTIPEPHATLQGAAKWQNQCHNRTTLQGVRIPSAILKIVFCHIVFLFLMQFRLWRAAAFVSSPIYLFQLILSCLNAAVCLLLQKHISSKTADVAYSLLYTICTICT